VPLACKSTPTFCERDLRESSLRKAENRFLQRWTWWSRLLLLVLLPAWIFSLVWSLCTAAPAVAGKKSRGLPTRSAPAKKEQPAPVLSYEKRLQKALELTQQNKWPQAIQSIGTLYSAAPVTPTVGRLWFLRATLAQKLQDAPTAVHAFTQVWHTYPPLADYAAWEIAQIYAAEGRIPELQETIMALAEQYPFSRLVPDGQFLLAHTQHRLAYIPEAQATLKQLLKTYADYPARPEVLAFLGEIYEGTGDLLRAFQTLQQLGDSYPRHPLAAAALEHSRQLLARLPAEQRPQPEPWPLLASIDSLTEAKLWQEVEARLATLEEFTEPSTLVLKVLLKQAAVAIRRQRLADANTILQEIKRRFPKGTHLGEVQYLLTIVRSRQGQRASLDQPSAPRLLQQLLLAWSTKTAVTLAVVQNGGQQVALRTEEFYQRLVRDASSADTLGQSLWQAGWEQYRQARYGAAERLWSEFETRYPRAALLPQVLYWQARAAILNDHLDTAIRLYQRLINDYPAHYYSRLAATSRQSLEHRLQSSGVVIASVDETPPTIPWTPPRPPRELDASSGQSTRERFHFIRIQELQQLRMHPLAAREIHTLAPLLPQTTPVRYFLATLCASSQEHVAVLRFLSGIIEAMSPAEVRGLSRTFWTLLFPRAFWPEGLQQSKRLGLNPYVVLSIMRQESAFNPTAVSRAGAIGLMQLMPATAQEVASRLALPQDSIEQLHDPQLSITLGTHYFAELLEHYQGNVVLALAAYNAGPGQVARWLEQWSHFAMEEFIEHIPFDETRAYVKLVLRNLAVYERLYRNS
jgi:TolA-binding protein